MILDSYEIQLVFEFENLLDEVNHERLTRLDEDGETEIGYLERRILGLTEKKEILRLEVSVHNSHGVTAVDNVDDLAADHGGGALGVVSFRDDPIEELAAGARTARDPCRS